MLHDSFGRIHDYLRISLTDVCNFRCFYCMPDEDVQFMPPSQLMQADEIFSIAKIFTELGVKKIRLTGGEPLVRKDAAEIIDRLSRLNIELTLTTNGTRVDQFIGAFRNAHIRSLNVSLDTLKPEKFRLMTGRDQFEKVWNNIQLLISEGFHVKLNAVAMEGVNDDEILAFTALTKELPIHVRFIEFMPFTGNHWSHAKVLPFEKMMTIISSQFDLETLVNHPHDTSKKFAVKGHAGTIAFISTMTEPFCSGCNRMRLTADGKMKNCLFSKGEADLLTAYRNGDDLSIFIRENLRIKEWERGGQIPRDFSSTEVQEISNRSMIRIGG